jgi:hypothetical protein
MRLCCMPTELCLRIYNRSMWGCGLLCSRRMWTQPPTTRPIRLLQGRAQAYCCAGHDPAQCRTCCTTSDTGSPAASHGSRSRYQGMHVHSTERRWRSSIRIRSHVMNIASSACLHTSVSCTTLDVTACAVLTAGLRSSSPQHVPDRRDDWPPEVGSTQRYVLP